MPRLCSMLLAGRLAHRMEERCDFGFIEMSLCADCLDRFGDVLGAQAACER